MIRFFVSSLGNWIGMFDKCLPYDFYPLKQQAIGSASPHRAFPLRSGIEKTYQVICSTMPGQWLGTLSYSQVLHEAFPGLSLAI